MEKLFLMNENQHREKTSSICEIAWTSNIILLKVSFNTEHK